jgi:hypothetical protein
MDLTFVYCIRVAGSGQLHHSGTNLSFAGTEKIAPLDPVQRDSFSSKAPGLIVGVITSVPNS